MCLHEQRLVEDQSGLSEYEKLAVQADDDDRYDSEADEESDRLEASLEREKVTGQTEKGSPSADRGS